MVGVFCALDFVLFFVFWEAMLIPMALLIGVWGGPRRVYAALKFFIYTMAGSVLLLVAIIALGLETGTFSIPDLMGRRSPGNLPVLGLPRVLPLVRHQGADVPVPHLVAGGARRGAHRGQRDAGQRAPEDGHLRLPAVLPADHARRDAVFHAPVLGLSVVAILYGGLTALAQSDLKKLVAYSSVGHMGFATLGIFVLNQDGIEGALLVMINHGVTTGALFIASASSTSAPHPRPRRGRRAWANTCRLRRVPRRVLPVLAGLSRARTASSASSSSSAAASPFAKNLVRDAAGVVPGVVLPPPTTCACCSASPTAAPAIPTTRAADLNLREILTLAPLLVFVFWIGLNPQPFTASCTPA
jgi:NADH-quinone oxidoreductase subunit M